MQILKRTLSIMLCCILLASFAPMVYAEDVLIEKASATFTVPYAGETFDFNAVEVPDDAHYTAQAKVYYWKNGAAVYLTAEDTVLKGVTYFVRVTFNAESGYELSLDKTEYTVNGKVITGLVGTNTVETTFTSADKPDDPTPETPTFGQRVLAFFRGIRDKIARFFWTILLLLGLV